MARHPATTVVTVFGGRPDNYPEPPTSWDADGGFENGDDVVVARREEDRRALDVLGAEQVFLDFVDYQYPDARANPAPEAIVPDLAGVVRRVEATAVLLPTGLAHPDHVATHDASMLVRDQLPDLGWFCYQEAGYAQLPGLLAWRLAKLLRAGIWPTPSLVPLDPDMQRKRAAIQCYASQIPPLEKRYAMADALDSGAGEQYYRLAPPPEGWEPLVDQP